jgi:hypothetical protein
MRRREFITGVGSGIAAAWSGTVKAQQPNLPVIGFYKQRVALGLTVRLPPLGRADAVIE